MFTCIMILSYCDIDVITYYVEMTSLTRAKGQKMRQSDMQKIPCNLNSK